MKGTTEKLTIKITEGGEVILRGQNNFFKLTAGEAIMLFDILRNEEENLKKMAEEASPISIKLF